MSNAAGNKIAELNTVISFPIDKVKDAIAKIAELGNTKESAFRLSKQDPIFNSYEFYLIQANKIGGITSGRTFINLISKDGQTEVHAFSTCSTTDSYADNIHVTNVQTIQSRILSYISDVLSGKEINSASMPQVGKGCLGVFLVAILLGLVFVLVPFLSSAQTPQIPTNAHGKYEFVHKIQVNEGRKEIFKRLHEWLAIRKFGEPISINTLNRKTFTGKLAANNFDYVDTSEYRIRGTGYVQYSPVRPYMYVTFDFQLIAEDGAYTYDFKRFNVMKFVKGKSMKAHSLRVSIYSGGGGNMSDAQSDNKPLEDVVSGASQIRSKIIRKQNLNDIELFKENMKDMILQLNRTVRGEF